MPIHDRELSARCTDSPSRGEGGAAGPGACRAHASEGGPGGCPLPHRAGRDRQEPTRPGRGRGGGARGVPRGAGIDAEGGAETGIDLRIDLARALQRTGRHEQATHLLQEARALAENAQDPLRMADIDRRLALGTFWAGRLHEALAHWTRGMEEADGAGDPRAGIRLRLAASACLLQMARPGEAETMAREALELAEEEGDPELRAAAHRSLLLHFAWSGPPDEARRHGECALALAGELDAATPRFSTHWALAILSGLTGDQEGVRAHLDSGWSIARELGSPLLNLHLAEIEWSAGLGRWEAGMDVAEESIRMARELNKGMILSRLLVWSGLLHLARGERDVARRELDEAWERWIGIIGAARP